jgi:hypothetical protein
MLICTIRSSSLNKPKLLEQTGQIGDAASADHDGCPCDGQVHTEHNTWPYFVSSGHDATSHSITTCCMFRVSSLGV